jgi:hypothetical protein
MFYLLKKIALKSESKNNVVLGVGNVRLRSPVSSCLYQTGEGILCHGNGSPDDILSICLAQENREMYP